MINEGQIMSIEDHLLVQHELLDLDMNLEYLFPYEVDCSSIKHEVLNNEYFVLSPEGMDAFGNNPNNYQMLQNNGNQEDDQVEQLFADEPFGKYSMGLDELCSYDPNKSETSTFLKYKVRDGKQIKVWECGICSKEFGHQYTLMRHIPTHTDERKFQCNTCGKAFRQMSTLSQHRAIHSSDRPYICEVCQKTFNRVSTLISHRKTHTGWKPHRCHLCNKAFHQKGNLRNHVFTHTNERPYKCDLCSKGFNQMSNLMCHKVKAHQRAEKPRYVCQICNKDFQKRIGLRNHEQYQHGVQNTDTINGSLTPTVVKYSNGVLVDPINTAAMQHALASNQSPFALLRPLFGIPVLVRVLSAGSKHMLVPATAEDLKKHGKITITPQVLDENTTESCEEPQLANDKEEHEINVTGSTVQIKIPIVATVVQKCGLDGNMCMSVESPGPNSSDGVNNNFYVTSTTKDDGDFENTVNLDNNDEINSTQFIGDGSNLLKSEESSNTFFGNDFPTQHMDIYSTNNEFTINQNEQEILQQIDSENVMNISFVENTPQTMFEEIDKSQIMLLNDTENVLYEDVEDFTLE